jgi:hypothetical protein
MDLLEFDRIDVYTWGECRDTPFAGTGLTYLEAAQQCADSSDPRTSAVALCALGRCQPPPFSCSLDLKYPNITLPINNQYIHNREMQPQYILYTTAVTIDPAYWLPYYLIAMIRHSIRHIPAPDTPSYTVWLARALDLNPTAYILHLQHALWTTDPVIAMNSLRTAAQLNPNISHTYSAMALLPLAFIQGMDAGLDPCLKLLDGRMLTKRALYDEALRCDNREKHALAFYHEHMRLGTYTCRCGNKTIVHLCMPGEQRPLSCTDVGVRMLVAYKDAVIVPFHAALVLECRAQNRPWSRLEHAAWKFRIPPAQPVNRLFATLLLAFARLEQLGQLPPAHHSMLEDLLTEYTWQFV